MRARKQLTFETVGFAAHPWQQAGALRASGPIVCSYTDLRITDTKSSTLVNPAGRVVHPTIVGPATRCRQGAALQPHRDTPATIVS